MQPNVPTPSLMHTCPLTYVHEDPLALIPTSQGILDFRQQRIHPYEFTLPTSSSCPMIYLHDICMISA